MKLKAAVLFCVLLAGCATETVPVASNPDLAPGDGLMAVGFDKDGTPIHWALLEAAGGVGDSVRVTNVGQGLSMYLYEVKAGRYCLTRYNQGNSTFKSKEAASGLCATVRPGHLAYFGHLSPAPQVGRVEFVNGRPQIQYSGDIYQTYQYELLYEELKRDYPAIFARYAAELEAPELKQIEHIDPSVARR
jgi:hypothetical protein